MNKKPIRINVWEVLDDMWAFVLIVICHALFWAILFSLFMDQEKIYQYSFIASVISSFFWVTRE